MKCIPVVFIFTCIILNSSVHCYRCNIYSSKQRNTVEFRCSGLTSLLKYLDKAKSNTTAIVVSDSNIADIPGHAFARFGSKLQTLDLHNAQINNIDFQAFVALTKLENLILWGNKLTWLPMEWFVNTYNLKTLDVSFNFIENIDYRVFQMLPNLENFYFDYNQLRTIDFNMFAYLTKLKKARIGKNPWNWAVRTRLIWELENQNVDIINNFEDWTWMSRVIKQCIETGQYFLPNDNVLDCVVKKLLEFVREAEDLAHSQQPIEQTCDMETRQLITCMRPKNSNASDNYESIRLILQDLSNTLTNLYSVDSAFPMKLFA